MRRACLVLVAAVAIAGCAGQSADPDGYHLLEFAIDGPSRLASGTSQVAVSNGGQFPHTLVVTDEAGDVTAATRLIAPGESTVLEIDLEPGTYAFTCRIVAETPAGDIVDHFEAGMHTRVSVGSG